MLSADTTASSAWALKRRFLAGRSESWVPKEEKPIAAAMAWPPSATGSDGGVGWDMADMCVPVSEVGVSELRSRQLEAWIDTSSGVRKYLRG